MLGWLSQAARARARVVPRLPGGRGALLLVLVVAAAACGGCGGRTPPVTGPVAPTGPATVASPPKTNAAPAGYDQGEASAPVTLEAREEIAAFSSERKKEQEVEDLLRRVQDDLGRGSPDSAMRDLEQLKQRYADDSYVQMRVAYMMARVAHRQNNGKRRKQAMDDMLKAMEATQKDARFLKAHGEGRSAQEVVRESIKRAGGSYGAP